MNSCGELGELESWFRICSRCRWPESDLCRPETGLLLLVEDDMTDRSQTKEEPAMLSSAELLIDE